MSRLGYLFAVLVIGIFGAYAWWPTPEVIGVKILGPVAARDYTVRSGGISAKVGRDVTTVKVGSSSYEFATDAEKAPRIWGAFSAIDVPAAKVIRDIGEGQLSAYGIDDSREAITDDGSVRLRWGGSGEQAYIWNGIERTLYAVNPAALAGIDAAAKPPFRAAVLATPSTANRLTVDGLSLVNEEGQWQAELFRNRPAFNARVTVLMSLLARISIDDLEGQPAIGLPVVGVVELPASAGSPAPGSPGAVPGQFSFAAQPVRTVTLHSDGLRGVIAISGFPVQHVGTGQLAELRTALTAFTRNPLIELFNTIAKDDVLQVDVAHGRTPWWSLRRREKPPAVGGFFWDVAWSNGRESAPDDAIEQLAALVSSVSVREPVADRTALANVPDDALVISVASDRPGGQTLRFALAGGELITASHRGRIDDDGLLRAAFAPERFLDPRLTRRDPTRVAKIQRRFRDESPPRDEVVARTDGGTWVRTYPASVPASALASGTASAASAAPVSGAAIDRLVRVLVGARVADLALVVPDGKAGDALRESARDLLAAPDFEFDVRFAAVVGGQASNDETDLDLTAAQDWGFAAKRSAAGWTCVDKDLGLRFTLDSDTMEELRAAFNDGLVFPVVASVVTRVEIRRADGTLVILARSGAGWQVTSGSDAAKAADAVAVRRYFRTLGSLVVSDSTVIDARVPEPAAGDIVAAITCAVPAIGGDVSLPTELLTLAVLRPTAAGTPVHVWSNRGGSRFPRGRAMLSGSSVAEALPDAAAFGQ